MQHPYRKGGIELKRVAKSEGAYNVTIEEVEVPEPRETEVLIRAVRTLISRGSEIWRRYVRPEAIDHRMMGYSLAGVVERVGSKVTAFKAGDRVVAGAPHAQYVTVDVESPSDKPTVVDIPDHLSFEAATFWPLSTSSVLWMEEVQARPGATMVIMGQGLVGSCCMQVALSDGAARVIAVDALERRCELAADLGAHEVVNAASEDPVEAVMRMTNRIGAEIVVEAVGGRAGPKAFEQGLDMLREGGLIQVIGLYEEQHLPLDSRKIQRRRLVGGYLERSRLHQGSKRALSLLADGKIQANRMVSHRFHFADAPEAFDLLYNRLGETMGVVLDWEG